jgi:hypothetical protein
MHDTGIVASHMSQAIPQNIHKHIILKHLSTFANGQNPVIINSINSVKNLISQIMNESDLHSSKWNWLQVQIILKKLLYKLSVIKIRNQYVKTGGLLHFEIRTGLSLRGFNISSPF